MSTDPDTLPTQPYRYFYDCEFIEDGRTIELVSIGVVDERGREFYAISTEFDPTAAVPWVKRNVLDRLPSPGHPAWRSRDRIRDDLFTFLIEPLATRDLPAPEAAPSGGTLREPPAPGASQRSPRSEERTLGAGTLRESPAPGASQRSPRSEERTLGAGTLREIELWAWYAAYDHVVLAQLWGRMPDLPREIPRFTKDLRQLWDDRGRPPLPQAEQQRHDALVDARHNLARWHVLRSGSVVPPNGVRSAPAAG